MRLMMNKLMRNGSEIAKDVLMPIGVGGAGFVAARALSNIGMVKDKLGDNAKIVTPILGVVATLALAKPLKLSTVNRNFLALGMGVVAVDALMKKVAPGFMADRAPAPSGTAGFGSYYDVSAAGAPYQGMFGVGEMYEAAAGNYDDPTVAAEFLLGDAEQKAGVLPAGVAPVSTIEPTDVAREASNFASIRPTQQQFAARSQAGGLFARNLFTGVTG
jgi:hypothetical protein